MKIKNSMRGMFPLISVFALAGICCFCAFAVYVGLVGAP